MGFNVIESRKTSDAIRRRLACSDCSYRETVFELSQDLYNSYQENLRIVSKLREALGVRSGVTPNKTKSKRASCLMCSFMSGKGCFFDFPEAGDAFAAECSQYDPVQDG